jgi:mannosyltransferase
MRSNSAMEHAVRKSWLLAALAAALALGTFLMAFRLGADELSGDEALSWAAASAPTIAQMVAIQHQINSGKLAFHELLLREWMRVFGTGEAAMRALSVMFGLMSLWLVYLLTAEWAAPSPGLAAAEPRAGPDPRAVAAACVLMCAASVPMLKVSREVRMYALMLAMLLAQMYFLLRAWRRGGIRSYAGVALFTAGSVAANFTAVLVMASEALWLLWLRLRRGPVGSTRDSLVAWKLAAAIGAGGAMLAPFLSGLLNGVTGVRRGDFRWIRAPLRWEPIATFEGAVGTIVFPLLALLAIAGAIAWWRRAERRDGFVLAMVILWVPPLVLMAGTWLLMPMLVTRYVILSFVPIYMLAAFGIMSMNGGWLRGSLLAAIMALSLVRAINYLRVDRNDRIREACVAALAIAPAHERIGTLADHFIVSYYMPPQRRADLVVMGGRDTDLREEPAYAVIVGSRPRPKELRAVRALYPRVIARFPHGVLVLAPATRPETGGPEVAPN